MFGRSFRCPIGRRRARGLEEEIASDPGCLGQCLRLRPVYREAPIKHLSNGKLRELGSP